MNRPASHGRAFQPSAFAGIGAMAPQQQGLSGIQWAQSSWCEGYDQALDAMVLVVKQGQVEGLKSVTFNALAERAAKETSWNLFGRTYASTLYGNCTDRAQELASQVVVVNAQLKNPLELSKLVKDVANPVAAAERDSMSLLTKIAIIGGIAVAGIIGIAVITGQVAPLLRAVKR